MAPNDFGQVLVVDDDEEIREPVRLILEAEGLTVTTVPSAESAVAILGEVPFALMITDLSLSGMDGLTLLQRAQSLAPRMSSIILTGHGTVQTAVKALKMGAADYLTKPIRPDELMLRVKKVLHQWELENQVQALQQDANRRQRRMSDVLVGESAAMRDIATQIAMVAKSDVTVLITGESGTGKEVVARAIHRMSKRQEAPFVIVNCGALSEELLRDELFGHEPGAFTGATKAKKGFFDEADGGTLFLDEIGEMTPPIQVQLLRVLQSQQFTRVGGTKTIEVDVRLLSATNKNLEREVKRGTFREDLYYRINVVPIVTPPLRERRDDIPLLVNHFMARFRAELDVTTKGFTPRAMRLLMEHEWPGNVRELANKVKRLMVMTNQEWIDTDALGAVTPGAVSIQPSAEEPYQVQKTRFLDLFDRRYLEESLRRFGGNVSRAAQAAGMDRKSFWRKLKRCELDAELFRR
ncbi:MAG: sigma-54-dependent Fis family transcriptional regulator [Candidatus Schekmanbacteria bacterium]|nr:sigma-54-dependent Fis family transcriptional regulator [Candidatus Schekmanbacteria bacterium]